MKNAELKNAELRQLFAGVVCEDLGVFNRLKKVFLEEFRRLEGLFGLWGI